MPNQPHSDLPERLALAGQLESERNEVVSEWMAAVREDPEIPNADHLTLGALQDHLPQILVELVEALRKPPQDLQDAPEPRQTAREHGKMRWRSGYRFDELLRELARIREIILARAREYFNERNTSRACTEVEKQIRRFFDVIIVSSAQQFMDEQQAEVLLRTQQLRSAYELVQAATEQLRAVAQSRLRLLRGVSHELRNALQTVELAADSLLEEVEPENYRSLSSNLAGSATRLQRLLDRLHEFSTILAGEARLEVRRLDLPLYLQELEERHRPAAEQKGLGLEFTNPAELTSVTTDHTKLRTIADILVQNAIENTASGTVWLDIRVDPPGRWILRVIDTGSGIDPESARNVFSEFHHGRSDKQGVGLGLVIARHLANLMDGEITFQSSPGEGSCFEVNLPVDLSASAHPA